MNMRLVVVCAAALFPLASSPALAATVSGKASTVVEWYESPDGGTAVPVHQYLQVQVKDLKQEGLNFTGYGRLSDDLNDEVKADSRLYYAYLEKKGIAEHLDVRAGRQFIATTAGASIMDGLFLRYRNLGPTTVSLFGGGDVTYYKGYDAQDLIVGGEVRADLPADIGLALSLVQKWEEGDITHELIGLDADYDPTESVSLYGELQYNYLVRSVSYFLGGGEYRYDDRWSLTAEYLYSLPVFSATSIYSVFAVDEYQEVMTEATYRLQPGMQLYASYTRELYTNAHDAHVFELGLEKTRTDRWFGYLAGTLRDDRDGQDLRGVKAHLAYQANDRIQVGAGAHVDVLERRLNLDEDETTASRIWGDCTFSVSDKVELQAKVERVESDLRDEYYRGRVRLNVRF